MKESLAATVVWHPLWAVMVPSAPKDETLGLRFAEMRRSLSQDVVNLATFGWEAHGESPAALRFFAIHKDAGKPCAFQVSMPVSAQTYPCKPIKGEGICRLRFVLDFGRQIWLQSSGFPPSRELRKSKPTHASPSRGNGFVARDSYLISGGSLV